VGNCTLAFEPNGAGVLQQPASPGETPQVAWAQAKLKLAVETREDEEFWLVEGRRTPDEKCMLLKKWHLQHTIVQVTFMNGAQTFPVYDASFFPNSVHGAHYW